MGKIKQKIHKMSQKENTQKNNQRYSRKEAVQKKYRVSKRIAQSEEAFAAMQNQFEEAHDRSMSRNNLAKKNRSNGKLNKAQRSYDKVEEVIDVEKMNVAVKRQKQKFVMGR